MRPAITLPWEGQLNWSALRAFPRFLARRSPVPDEWLIGIGVADDGTASDARIGHFSFHLRPVTDQVSSRHIPQDGFAAMNWWSPDLLLRLSGRQAEVLMEHGRIISAAAFLQAFDRPAAASVLPKRADWTRHTSRGRYLAQVRLLLDHIQHGDIYEVNYCTRRTATLQDLDPFRAFTLLLAHTDAPYAAFYRTEDRFALCMSPEHFLHIGGDEVTTRPMKGTRRRSADAQEDAALASALAADAKERSENIMAVDVARNDLSRVAASASVTVPELCAVKTYPHVHQMVSTVRAHLKEGWGPMEVIRATFPMASMSGAPKRRALQLIDDVEDQARGLFSGALGYQLPDGTLDLNVVIRTITYNAATGEASLITGGAITAQSDPEQEWEECELKARSVLSALGHAG